VCMKPFPHYACSLTICNGLLCTIMSSDIIPPNLSLDAKEDRLRVYMGMVG
jgi:hypothetical protein